AKMFWLRHRALSLILKLNETSPVSGIGGRALLASTGRRKLRSDYPCTGLLRKLTKPRHPFGRRLLLDRAWELFWERDWEDSPSRSSSRRRFLIETFRI